ncbi:MAG: response regulator [Proteobacteria bacterium]|nr:MAG: response regulator [Pseudomonadota bacterium]
MHILWLLEDSDEDAEVFQFAAQAVGLNAEVKRFKTTADLLRHFDAPGTEPPALALIDLNLPGPDGRELINRLKADARFHAVPLLVLSSSASPADVSRSYAAGACAYLVKPLGLARYEVLIRAINDFWLGQVVRPGRKPAGAAANATP